MLSCYSWYTVCCLNYEKWKGLDATPLPSLEKRVAPQSRVF